MTLLTRVFFHELNSYDAPKKLPSNVDTFATHDESEFDESLFVIDAERNAITEAINNLCFLIASDEDESTSTRPNFFANSNIFRKAYGLGVRSKELVKEYNQLIDSYPDYEDFDENTDVM